MQKLLCVLVIAAAASLLTAAPASARWFEPVQHWWSAGRACVSARAAPSRRWQALPMRSCVSAPPTEAAAAPVLTPDADLCDVWNLKALMRVAEIRKAKTPVIRRRAAKAQRAVDSMGGVR